MVSKIDQFKLRAAYGETGSSASFGSVFTSLNQISIGGVGGSTIASLKGDKDIEPETSKEFEAGIDFRLITHGENATAVVVQSIGGGGGNGGVAISGTLSGAGTGAGAAAVGLGGSGGGGGHGGEVKNTVTGDVTTHQVDSAGVLAQSVGGGGGNGGYRTHNNF